MSHFCPEQNICFHVPLKKYDKWVKNFWYMGQLDTVGTFNSFALKGGQIDPYSLKIFLIYSYKWIDYCNDIINDNTGKNNNWRQDDDFFIFFSHMVSA